MTHKDEFEAIAREIDKKFGVPSLRTWAFAARPLRLPEHSLARELEARTEAEAMIKSLQDLVTAAGGTPKPRHTKIAEAMERAINEAHRPPKVDAEGLITDIMYRIEMDQAIHRDTLITIARRWGAV